MSRVVRAWKDAATIILAARFPRITPSLVKEGSNTESETEQNNAPGSASASASGDQNDIKLWSGNSGDGSPLLKTNTDIAPNFDYKVLMLERNSKSSFMPSAYVFPGGKICNADFMDRWSEVFRDVFELKGLSEYSLQRLGIKRPSPVDDHSGEDVPHRLPMFDYWDAWGRDVSSEIAFRISAIRETFEESGVLLCTNKDRISLSIDPNTEEVQLDHARLMDSCVPVSETFSHDELAKWRKEVNKDANKFIDMCSHLHVVPNVWCLQDWSCWLTPTNMPKLHNKRRYDTIFYLTCLPSPPLITHDGLEITSAEWASPLDVLCRHHAEELWLAPPQIYELCRLCSKPDLDDLFHFAQSRERLGIQRWLPVRIVCEDGPIAVLPGDELYPKNPDWEGQEASVSVPQSIIEMRSTTLAHHRFEFLGMHDMNVLCTESQTHGHLSPNPGHRAWQAARQQITLPPSNTENQ